jgi:choline-sulfatase
MLGERGMWYKMSFFEWSARVPLIIHAPNRVAPGRVAAPVSLVDILPTLLDIAGAQDEPALAAPIDGHSLVSPIGELEGRSVYGEMLGEGAIAPLLMVRRGDYKYIYSEPDPEQLYDLSADPHELTNLAGKGPYESILQGFRKERMAKWDVAHLREQVLASQRRRRLIDRALRKGTHTPWDFQPFEDSSQRYMRNHLDLNVLEGTSRFPSPEIPPPDGPGRPG